MTSITLVTVGKNVHTNVVTTAQATAAHATARDPLKPYEAPVLERLGRWSLVTLQQSIPIGCDMAMPQFRLPSLRGIGLPRF